MRLIAVPPAGGIPREVVWRLRLQRVHPQEGDLGPAAHGPVDDGLYDTVLVGRVDLNEVHSQVAAVLERDKSAVEKNVS